jgi:tetratricopeptide (TPR) repeat protein
VAEDIAEARRQVKLRPFSAEAWGNLGLVLQLYLYHAEANACYRRAAQLDPRSPRWPYLQAGIQMRSDLEASLPLLERAVQLGGEVDTPRLVLGETLLLRGRVDEAEEHFRAVLGSEPENARALLGLGQAACSRGDLAAARDFLERSAAAAPRVRATHVLLAQTFHQLGDQPRADAERALATRLPEKFSWPDPYRVGVLRELCGEAASVARAKTLREQGQGKEAIDLLQATLRRYPHSYLAYQALGRTYLLQGDFAAAEMACREAVRLKPDDLESQFEYGLALEQQGRHPAAAQCFRRALELRAEFGEAHYHLGRCLEALGDEAGALRAYRDAVRYQPDLVAAQQTLGAMLAAKYHYAEARKVLEHALLLDPSHEKTRQWLEIVRQRLDSPGPGVKPR